MARGTCSRTVGHGPARRELGIGGPYQPRRNIYFCSRWRGSRGGVSSCYFADWYGFSWVSTIRMMRLEHVLVQACYCDRYLEHAFVQGRWVGQCSGPCCRGSFIWPSVWQPSRLRLEHVVVQAPCCDSCLEQLFPQELRLALLARLLKKMCLILQETLAIYIICVMYGI